MPTGRRKYYWDACIFIAWIKDEKRAAGEMEGIVEIADQVDKGQAILMTSVLSRIEVLESTMSDADRGKFEAALRRRFVQPIACDMRVADKSHEIRDYYQTRNIKIATPDAIHLATAIVYGADEFCTFDGTNKASAKWAKLIPLSGDVAGHPLLIKAPMAQPNLLTGTKAISLTIPRPAGGLSPTPIEGNPSTSRSIAPQARARRPSSK